MKPKKNSQVARFENVSEDQLQQILAERHSLGIKKVTNWSLITLNVKFPLLLLVLNLLTWGIKYTVVNWEFTKKQNNHSCTLSQ